MPSRMERTSRWASGFSGVLLRLLQTPYSFPDFILFYFIHVYMYILLFIFNCTVLVFILIVTGLLGCPIDSHSRRAGKGAC